ncbi:MAG: TonB-dependent receptor family protein [Saprospiraceae bacterium]|nr:TonB-dependent receptor family protein [Saprospiraceae bacterium]
MFKASLLKIILGLITCLLVFQNVQGQSIRTLKGYVRGNDQALVGASISVKNNKNNDLIKGDFSEQNGSFEMMFSSSDTIVMAVSYLGYEDVSKEIVFGNNSHYDIGEIILEISSVKVNEITVSASKTFAIQKIDRVVINPEALISNAGITGLELMERSPGVSVDMNGNISIRGKSGVMVFIDDKPSYLTGADLANYLRSIPSSSIASIEIMTNPPAKYDAAGNAGVINIRLKKNVATGWNGGVNLSFGQGRHSRSNNSANLNYRVGKFNFFSNVSANYNKSYQDLTIERNYFDGEKKATSSFIQKTLITPIGKNANAKIGLDFYVNDKLTLGFSTGGLLTDSERNLTNAATVTDGKQNVTSYVDADNPTSIQFNNYFINGNAGIKFKDKSELTLNLDYIEYDNKIDQVLTNKILNPQKMLQSVSILASDLPTDLKIKSIKLDYLKTLKNGRAEAGLKSSIVSADNKAQFYDVVSGQRRINNEFSNQFLYDENINAAYINYSADFSKISFQLGLRAENTNIDGNQLGNEVVKDSSFKNSYTSLFPTFFLQYRMDSLSNHVFGLSLGRRVDRPAYKDLNPFSYPMDRFTYYGGNPFLVPTFAYNVDMTYTYKNFLTTTLTYSRADDVIFETNEQRGTIYYSRPGNFAKQIAFGISINGSQKLTKWWTLQLYAARLKNEFVSQVYTEFLDDSRWYTVISPVNQFIINKRWSAELAGNYQSTVLMGQFIIQPIYSVRAGLSTKILKEKGSLKFNVSDIFYTNQIEGDIRNIANANANWFSYLDSRVATLSFSWRFSKGQTVRLRQTGGTEAEQKRVKS